MDGKSLTPQEIKLQQLKEILPEAFAEGKVDWEKLKATLGEDINFANERYVLNWAGKSEAFKVLQAPTTKTLVPDKEESVNFDKTENIFIEGENMEVLKVLQKSYFGKVKMIYIDPPYNTGNDSFIYPDKFSESKAEYQRRVGDKDEEGYLTKDGMFRKNSKENGQYHSNWLNMMYPRLFLAKNLLKQDGVIFISIDDNEVDNLRLMMNEVFGEENFRGDIVRATGTTTGQEALKIGSSYDSCLCYAKSNQFELKGIPLKGKDLNRFNNDDNDGKGKYALLQLRKTGNADRKEDREGMFFPITAPDGSLVFPIGPTDYLSRWRTGKKKFQSFLNEGLIVWKKNGDDIEEFDDYEEENGDDDITDYTEVTNENVDISKYKSKWKPYVKYYLSERTKQVSNLWTDVDGNKKGSIELKELFDKKKLFENPKPTDFLKRILIISCNINDYALDFFAGSGTTAHAVMQLNSEDGGNRKCISVQLPEITDEKSEAYKAGYKTIADIAKERIRRAGKKIQKEIKEKIKAKEKEIEELESQLDIDGKEEKINKLKTEIEQLKNQDLGFKVLKLSDSNFKQWQQIQGNDAEALEKQMKLFVDPVSETATTENMVYELLLKSGKDLNSILRLRSGYYVVNEEELILMLEKATQEIVNKVIAEKPQKVVALDRLFKGNDQLKTNTSLQMKDAEIEFKTI